LVRVHRPGEYRRRIVEGYISALRRATEASKFHTTNAHRREIGR
jgi:hypothetical protein